MKITINNTNPAEHLHGFHLTEDGYEVWIASDGDAPIKLDHIPKSGMKSVNVAGMSLTVLPVGRATNGAGYPVVTLRCSYTSATGGAEVLELLAYKTEKHAGHAAAVLLRLKAAALAVQSSAAERIADHYAAFIPKKSKTLAASELVVNAGSPT